LSERQKVELLLRMSSNHRKVEENSYKTE
jgi:hypothetical protein